MSFLKIQFGEGVDNLLLQFEPHILEFLKSLPDGKFYVKHEHITLTWEKNAELEDAELEDGKDDVLWTEDGVNYELWCDLAPHCQANVIAAICSHVK